MFPKSFPRIYLNKALHFICLSSTSLSAHSLRCPFLISPASFDCITQGLHSCFHYHFPSILLQVHFSPTLSLSISTTTNIRRVSCVVQKDVRKGPPIAELLSEGWNTTPPFQYTPPTDLYIIPFCHANLSARYQTHTSVLPFQLPPMQGPVPDGSHYTNILRFHALL